MDGQEEEPGSVSDARGFNDVAPSLFQIGTLLSTANWRKCVPPALPFT